MKGEKGGRSPLSVLPCLPIKTLDVTFAQNKGQFIMSSFLRKKWRTILFCTSVRPWVECIIRGTKWHFDTECRRSLSMNWDSLVPALRAERPENWGLIPAEARYFCSLPHTDQFFPLSWTFLRTGFLLWSEESHSWTPSPAAVPRMKYRLPEGAPLKSRLRHRRSYLRFFVFSPTRQMPGYFSEHATTTSFRDLSKSPVVLPFGVVYTDSVGRNAMSHTVVLVH